MLQEFRHLDLCILDESFLYFTESAISNVTGMDFMNEFPNLVIVNSLSKAYGIAGLRLGYAASGNKDLITTLRTHLPIWSINSLAQLFLENMAKYRVQFSDSCRQVRSSTQNLYQELQKIPMLQPYPTEGNYILCRLTNGLTASEITSLLFQRYNILVNDCSRKHGLDDRFFRIASRTEEENGTLLQALEEIGRQNQTSQGIG